MKLISLVPHALWMEYSICQKRLQCWTSNVFLWETNHSSSRKWQGNYQMTFGKLADVTLGAASNSWSWTRVEGIEEVEQVYEGRWWWNRPLKWVGNNPDWRHQKDGGKLVKRKEFESESGTFYMLGAGCCWHIITISLQLWQPCAILIPFKDKIQNSRQTLCWIVFALCWRDLWKLEVGDC